MSNLQYYLELKEYIVDPDRNTLLKSTEFNNKWWNFHSREEKIYRTIIWKLNNIITPEQVVWEYEFLSDKSIIKRIVNTILKKEDKNIDNAITYYAKNILNWLLVPNVNYNNYPDHIVTESEKLIFTYAIQHWIYSKNEVNEIVFGHWETKEDYIEKYWVKNRDELLEKLKEIWEKETESLKNLKK
jgi:hypothetical protein